MELFIGCSSNKNVGEDVYNKSKELIEEISKIPDINLVFGAYDKGLMGEAFNSFKNNNKHIIGVRCKCYSDDSNLYGDEIIVNNTMERFSKIYDKSDLLLFLPGGIGTYTELFNAICEVQIGNKKKIILYNPNFFFTEIIKELYNLYERGLFLLQPSDYMLIESDKDEIIKEIKNERI